jgi:phosphate:Na+ symporter
MGIDSITGLIGGLGLFLVGMWLMTEGLKVAAGPSLKMLLERWTNSRAKGLATGFALTALVQSSSAVTVAAIGFVNAGVLTLGQAVWVIFGSNVGTTMTGWIVATIGFNVNIEFLALPLIGIGMGVRLLLPGMAKGALGEAIAGFGLFFLGVSVLKETFEGIAALVPVEALTGGYLQDFLFLLAGFAITALAQSSSASIAVALSAVSGGLVSLETGAAMVIGANLGTTVTGVLAVLNATSNAKRVAASHVIFNLATGALAFLILPGFVWLTGLAVEAGYVDPAPAAVLALFHTLFNVSGVLLFWFIGGRLVRRLETMFTTQEESEARPRHLDTTLKDIPSLAAASLLLELRRFGGMASEMVVQFVRTPVLRAAQVGRRALTLSKLSEAIGEYAAAMSAARLPDRLPDALAHALRALQHYNGMVHELQELIEHAAEPHRLPENVASDLLHFRSALVDLLSDPALADTTGDGDTLTARGQAFETEYQRIKNDALAAASRGGVMELKPLDDAIREADLVRRISHHAVRAAMRIRAAEAIIAPPPRDVPSEPEAEAVVRNE